jgi:hypothetical protein
MGNVRHIAIMGAEYLMAADSKAGIATTDYETRSIISVNPLRAFNSQGMLPLYLAHEVAHTFESDVDLSQFSKGSEIARLIEAIPAKSKLSVNGWFAYPFAMKETLNSSDGFAAELHAQAFAVYADERTREMMRKVAPGLLSMLENFYGDLLNADNTQRPQDRTGVQTVRSSGATGHIRSRPGSEGINSPLATKPVETPVKGVYDRARVEYERVAESGFKGEKDSTRPTRARVSKTQRDGAVPPHDPPPPGLSNELRSHQPEQTVQERAKGVIEATGMKLLLEKGVPAYMKAFMCLPLPLKEQAVLAIEAASRLRDDQLAMLFDVGISPGEFDTSAGYGKVGYIQAKLNPFVPTGGGIKQLGTRINQVIKRLENAGIANVQAEGYFEKNDPFEMLLDMEAIPGMAGKDSQLAKTSAGKPASHVAPTRTAGSPEERLRRYLAEFGNRNVVWRDYAKKALGENDVKSISNALAAAKKQFGELSEASKSEASKSKTKAVTKTLDVSHPDYWDSDGISINATDGGAIADRSDHTIN